MDGDEPVYVAGSRPLVLERLAGRSRMHQLRLDAGLPQKRCQRLALLQQAAPSLGAHQHLCLAGQGNMCSDS